MDTIPLTLDVLRTGLGLEVIAQLLLEGLKNKGTVFFYADDQEHIRAVSSPFVINLLELPTEAALTVLATLGKTRVELEQFLSQKQLFQEQIDLD